MAAAFKGGAGSVSGNGVRTQIAEVPIATGQTNFKFGFRELWNESCRIECHTDAHNNQHAKELIVRETLRREYR